MATDSDKIPLTEDQMAYMTRSLVAASTSVLNAHENLDQEKKEMLQGALDDLRERLKTALTSRTYIRTDDTKRAKMDAPPHDPALDEELVQLEHQVNAIATRVASHREQVPALLAARLQEQLQELRPTVAEMEAAKEQEGGGQVEAEGLPVAAELHARFASAAEKLPSLRIRLEQALERLDRVTSAVEAEKVRSARTPGTVERVLAGKTEEGATGVESTPAIKAKAVAETRKRLAQHLGGEGMEGGA